MKTKLQIQKFFTVILCLLLSAAICNAQDKLAKKTVDDFLNVWLIKKHSKLVQKYFAKNIFTNKFHFSESCLGKPKELEQESIKFLQDITQHTYQKSLKNILNSEKLLKYEFYNFKNGKLLSAPKKDKFGLVKINSENLPKLAGNDTKDYFYQNLDYVKSTFPSKEYLFLTIIVKVKLENEKVDAPLYFIWIKQEASWKIIQFGMECQ